MRAKFASIVLFAGILGWAAALLVTGKDDAASIAAPKPQLKVDGTPLQNSGNGLIASYADTLVQASRPDVGLQKIEHAIELNPLPPDEYFWTAAGASYSLGHYSQALDYIARSPAAQAAA